MIHYERCTVSSGRRLDINREMCQSVLIPVGPQILRFYVPESDKDTVRQFLKVLGVEKIREARGKVVSVTVTGNTAVLKDPVSGESVSVFEHTYTYRPGVYA